MNTGNSYFFKTLAVINVHLPLTCIYILVRTRICLLYWTNFYIFQTLQSKVYFYRPEWEPSGVKSVCAGKIIGTLVSCFFWSDLTLRHANVLQPSFCGCETLSNTFFDFFPPLQNIEQLTVSCLTVFMKFVPIEVGPRVGDSHLHHWANLSCCPRLKRKRRKMRARSK